MTRVTAGIRTPTERATISRATFTPQPPYRKDKFIFLSFHINIITKIFYKINIIPLIHMSMYKLNFEELKFLLQ